MHLIANKKNIYLPLFFLGRNEEKRDDPEKMEKVLRMGG